ncbi:MAG: hypothetical protein AB3N16_06205 [Flavobacteriaceae bacterium]
MKLSLFYGKEHGTQNLGGWNAKMLYFFDGQAVKRIFADIFRL